MRLVSLWPNKFLNTDFVRHIGHCSLNVSSLLQRTHTEHKTDGQQVSDMRCSPVHDVLPQRDVNRLPELLRAVSKASYEDES